ncbi:hypothetical protein FM038_014325 [Shewanella eurypsychrophilus]|uniref:Outer membrane protein beta-barrel domain-containing protein n=1 Tax=Shewanella eurypsychrophilus TaxID=2593656 RepID=A0ABX6V7A3_9GAMM|nr:MULTISPECIES: autotransporter outer membrane beta-barrel domain-containing protein [Shewanella]QFU23201.1 hypothetical protein FS418_15905 [Shewanella sp. YLB-09]QPG58484.1 hypothetical protein FM038_014325 [Shewanella eurypsychrophilus]
MKNSIIALTVLVSIAANANEIDPSDLTQVNSFASGMYNSDKEITVMGGVAGAYSEGNSFIGLIEHKTATTTGDDGKKAQDTRLRYFQVFDVSEGSIPQVGFSVDYMKSWKMSKTEDASIGTDLIALGGIAKIHITDAISIYPNLAYVLGKADAGEANVQFDIKGYQTNIYGSWAITENGYVIVQPQYMNLDVESTGGKSGNAKVNVFKIKTGLGYSISDNGKYWIEFSHTYTRTDADALHIENNFNMVNKDNKFEISFSYYF